MNTVQRHIAWMFLFFILAVLNTGLSSEGSPLFLVTGFLFGAGFGYNAFYAYHEAAR